MTKRILTLRLKRKWWEQIRDGKKIVENRLRNDYWRKRLAGKMYDEIHLWLGYPPATDTSKLLVRQWVGFGHETITHEEFGPAPVDVYAIVVGVKLPASVEASAGEGGES